MNMLTWMEYSFKYTLHIRFGLYIQRRTQTHTHSFTEILFGDRKRVQVGEADYNGTDQAAFALESHGHTNGSKVGRRTHVRTTRTTHMYTCELVRRKRECSIQI